jgi:glycosyltransferase involved in cell wall biosynthesis
MKKISVLVLSNYMICPPISGGVKRMLAPSIYMDPCDNIEFTYMYLSYTKEEIKKNNSYLLDIVNVVDAEGILTSKELQFDWTSLPLNFPQQVWFTMNKNFVNMLKERLERNFYDIVQVEHPQFAWLVPYIRMVSPNSKVIMDCQNLEWLVFKRWIPYENNVQTKNTLIKDYCSLKRWEEEVLSWFDGIFCISPIEKEILQELTDVSLYYVPTGAGINDDDYYPIDKVKIKPFDMIFIGSMNWFPNSQALKWFLEEVMPIVVKKKPSAKLEIIGSSNPDKSMLDLIKKYPAVTFWGEVEDEIPFLHGSKIFVSPIWIGAGVRLKNPTAWAAKIPLVATTLSVEGLEYTSGKDLLIGDSPEAFADNIISILDNPALGEELAENAYITYKEKYGVKRITNIWKQAYNDVLNL